MKLSMEKMIAARSALVALDGYDKIIKDGERDRAVRELYKLGGGLRLLIAKNINLLDKEIDPFQRARNTLVMEHADASGSVPPDKRAEFVKQERELLDAEYDVDVVPIKDDELKLDQNPIPASVLAQLGTLLVEKSE